MSSQEISQISDVSKNGCFTFIWRIENFSYCPHDENEKLTCPSFIVEDLKGTEWQLDVFPGREKITCHMFRVNNQEEPEIVQANFKYAFITSDGSPHQWCEMNALKYKRGTSLGYIEMDRRIQNFKDIFLPSDTLTVMFHISSSDNKQWSNTQCVACTRIVVDRRCFNHTINKFLEYKCKALIPVRGTLLEISLVCVGGAIFDEVLQIKISRIGENSKKSLFSTCKISVLDVNGKAGFSAQDEHWFNNSDSGEWTFPSFIKVNKIAASKDRYLKNDKLTLRFEFAISSGVSSEYIEESIYELPFKQNVSETALVERRTLNNDLRSLYHGGDFSDVQLRAGNETFHAHSIILCARSAIFKAMFDIDMKEKNSGVVDIPDLSAEDLNRMLVFLYTDILDDLEWESAKSLFIVSDLYRIEELKKKCVSFMLSNISVTNVCEILLLAELYKDETLISAIRHFICERREEVFQSEEWRNILSCHRRVAADTMHYVLLNGV